MNKRKMQKNKQNFIKNMRKSALGLIFFLMILLQGCGTAKCESACPIWPYAGEKVADELNLLSAEEFPNLWKWLGKLAKLQEQLELCE